MADSFCRACGTRLQIDEPVGRDRECPGCGHDVRCCVNCRHYDTAYNNNCRETMADPVEDKHHRNFCEYFELNREPFQGKARQSTREADARRKLEDLFKPKPKS